METEAKSQSTICVENSEWVAENIKGLDNAVKEMQLLVEKDGKFSGDKHDDERLMHLELINRAKEISHRHHLLANHYKIINSQLNHPFTTPGKKLGVQNVVSVDSSLSSGGGISDTTPIGSSESSLLSSDSDSDSYDSSPIERLNMLPSGEMLRDEAVNSSETKKAEEYEMLMKISDYKKEAKVSREKLLIAEEEIAKLKSDLLKNEAFMVKIGSLEAQLAQLASAENQIKLYEADMEKENKKSLMLHEQIVDLESKLMSEKRQVEELQKSVKDCNFVINKLNSDLQDALGSFSLEKWQLESSISKLSEHLTFHEGRANELQKQCESLEAEKTEITENQEALQISWQHNLELVKIELKEKHSLVDSLNKNLEELELNYDILKAEKDGVEAKLQTLNTDLSVRNDQIQSFELELKSMNEQLCAGADSASKLTSELKSRILELEREVGMQAVMISDTAEGKREAIRQLSFSVDHFRSAYLELREEYAIRKRPAVMV